MARRRPELGPPRPPATDTQHLEGGGDPERAGGGRPYYPNRSTGVFPRTPTLHPMARDRCSLLPMCWGLPARTVLWVLRGAWGALIDVEARDLLLLKLNTRRRAESPIRRREGGSHRLGFMATDPCPHAPPPPPTGPNSAKGCWQHSEGALLRALEAISARPRRPIHRHGSRIIASRCPLLRLLAQEVK